jgi:glycosyltransferase involved in cell wall biosynthesis
MKILFDSQIFDEQKYGGISRYFSEIFKGLDSNKIPYEISINYSKNEYLKNIKKFEPRELNKKYNQRLFNKIDFKYKGFLRKYYDLLDPASNFNLSKKLLKKGDFDIFHPTYYHSYFLKYIKNKKFVLTIHDMIHELYPEYFRTDNGKTAKIKKQLALKANKIIAVSENTKKDIINFYKISPQKIDVIHLANSLKINSAAETIIEIPKKYILFVGSRNGYKNFLFFIKSISKILNEDKEIFVVTTGGYSGKNNFNKQEKQLFKDLNIENQIMQYPVNDAQLVYLYKHALCFAFPSLYEGFGIPILEAFSCECPVVASDSSSIPEVGSNAAKYFNPKDKNEIYKTTKEVIYNKNLRKEMIIKGKERLKNFSWDKTVEKTINLYNKL